MQKWLQNKDQIDLTDLLVILVFSSIPDVPDVPSLLFIHMPPYTTDRKRVMRCGLAEERRVIEPRARGYFQVSTKTQTQYLLIVSLHRE